LRYLFLNQPFFFVTSIFHSYSNFIATQISAMAFTVSYPSLGFQTGAAVRFAARLGDLSTQTSGLAPNYIQANLIVLPSRYASDFRTLCQFVLHTIPTFTLIKDLWLTRRVGARNPVPCALIAESKFAGSYNVIRSHMPSVESESIAASLDIRQDAPKYLIYKDGELVKECSDIKQEWTDDHVAFLIGCSFSFESALTQADLTPRHTLMDRIVPMYRTKVPLCKAGVFDKGTYVVSMRPYKKSEIESVRKTTRAYLMTHGEPIAWGWNAVEDLGITNIDLPEWGAPPLSADGRPLGQLKDDFDNVPVFWGCGTFRIVSCHA
jgi:uncharacterized protein YcsI (UPF0317 family)